MHQIQRERERKREREREAEGRERPPLGIDAKGPPFTALINPSATTEDFDLSLSLSISLLKAAVAPAGRSVGRSLSPNYF
jgi:hypothetical protein